MKIKRFIGAGLVSMSLMTTGAHAVDWSGPYIGAHAGQSFFSFDSLPHGLSGEPTGFSGGLHAGYQLQLGPFIVGVEGSYTALDIDDYGFTNFNNGTSTATAGVVDDYSTLDLGDINLTELTNVSNPTLADVVDAISELDLNNIDLAELTNGINPAFSGLAGSNPSPVSSNNGNTEPNNDADKFTAGVSDIFAVAARGGFAFGNAMAYGKVGYASAGIGYHNMINPTPASLLNLIGRESGLLLGVGTEFALTDNISIGVDYTYINFNIDTKIQDLNLTSLKSVIDENLDSDHHQLSVRLNFRLN